MAVSIMIGDGEWVEAWATVSLRVMIDSDHERC